MNSVRASGVVVVTLPARKVAAAGFRSPRGGSFSRWARGLLRADIQGGCTMMTEVERLRAENAELKAALAGVDVVMTALINMTSAAMTTISDSIPVFEAVAPELAVQAPNTLAQWREFMANGTGANQGTGLSRRKQ